MTYTLSRGEVEPIIALLAITAILITVLPMIFMILGGIESIHIDVLRDVYTRLRINEAIRKGYLSAWGFYNRTYNTFVIHVTNEMRSSIVVDEVILYAEVLGIGTKVVMYRPSQPITVDPGSRVPIVIDFYSLLGPITVVDVRTAFIVLDSGDMVPIDIVSESLYRQVEWRSFFNTSTFKYSNLTLFLELNNITLATTDSLYPLNRSIQYLDYASMLRSATIINGFCYNTTVTEAMVTFDTINYSGAIAILTDDDELKTVSLTIYRKLNASGTLFVMTENCDVSKVIIHGFNGTIYINNTSANDGIYMVSNISLSINGSAKDVVIYCQCELGHYEPTLLVGYINTTPILIFSTIDIDYNDTYDQYNMNNVCTKPLIMVSNRTAINGSSYGMLLIYLDIEVRTLQYIPIPEAQPVFIVGLVNSSGYIVEATIFTLKDFQIYGVLNNRRIIEVYLPIPNINQELYPFIGFYETYGDREVCILIHSIDVELFRRG